MKTIIRFVYHNAGLIMLLCYDTLVMHLELWTYIGLLCIFVLGDLMTYSYALNRGMHIMESAAEKFVKDTLRGITKTD